MTLMSRIQTCILIAFFIMCCAATNAAQAAEETYQVTGLEDQVTDGGWGLNIKGTGLPTYTQYELFNPHRIIIDIAKGSLGKEVVLPWKPNKGPLSSVSGSVIDGQDPAVLRFELVLKEESKYAVNINGNNILVQFAKATSDSDQKSQAQKVPLISQVDVTPGAGYTNILLKAGQKIEGCKTIELAKAHDRPARLIVDIDTVKTRELAVPGETSESVSLVRALPYNGKARIMIDSAHDQLFTYNVESHKEGLLIRVEPPKQDTAGLVAGITGVPQAEIAALQIPVKEETAVKRPVSLPAKQAKPKASVAKSTASAGGDPLFSGYTEERISVDFYKIDLHNVFRLIGDISGRNIVVDQGVSGALTLALTDVPWDFVLDVIMNLKGLAKEERYNTIVISKKDKEFTWPIKIQDSLEIKKEEAIKVTKRLDVPKEKIESKKLMRKASNLEQTGDYKGALALYEKAFQASPDNGDLAKKICSLALVRMGLNAKAAHYGRLAVQLKPNDSQAALHAALSLANMEQVREARDYFERAVAGSRPSRQALASYAAFSEQNNSLEMALSLLIRYEELYSGSVETMISKARIYDKLGNTEQANEEYLAILLSGYNMPDDLEKFIKNRVQK